MLPLVLSSLSNALVATRRISRFLLAEELANPYLIDESLKAAVHVDGDFTWEKAVHLTGSDVDSGAEEIVKKANENRNKDEQEHVSNQKDAILPTTVVDLSDSPPGETDDNLFELKNLKIDIPKGSFVAIVGQVGSGKVMLE
jgi:ABC-type multidrug transport system fused ATPase/permease subunit